MQAKKIWANLGVENIQRTQAFYLKLGFRPNGNPTDELVSFLFSDDDFVIHFFDKQQLKESLAGELANLNQGNEVMFTLSAGNKEEFDHWIEDIVQAGGKIFFNSNKNRNVFYDKNGYHVCVFADPDGHKFNLFYHEGGNA